MGSMFKEEIYCIPPLSNYSYSFPSPRFASDEGLLAYGGDLSSVRILTAYRNGIFPWYNKGDPILWWSPSPRLLLYPGKFIVQKSFRRILRNAGFSVTFDRHFSKVIHHCATIMRKGQNGSWILPEIQEAYIRLHEEGYAHSIEVHKEGKLVGGLYGISMGKAFFGESMFSLVKDASKVAFKALSDVLVEKSYDFIDCQMETDHMIRLGAVTVSRDYFLDLLDQTLQKPSELGNWQHFHWEYKEKENDGK
ncbi:MAG: leucyl/phenylalanyl-tRNA--protein transferase [Sulfurovum sp.]|nr:leucyl/phenylalanyl-tRNA--protein transferase [Sulfurovum sp.]MCB4744419.1 leucyl/phenylalanyl-tRNA--protein transferase [Sulfurovum sp.]MCB4745879.1 leucyl/phenylalanyl-tRNA--protein transferase [Sulfurovum sp.]MCB4747573.1 leucyl/phenylalanyl-tRNA--protein transferase [Sulfurovum sp.]MCB4748946.1 leucyl/phenylalanyl-tRNA--protein transferase [Sulfurovum sp.]